LDGTIYLARGETNEIGRLATTIDFKSISSVQQRLFAVQKIRPNQKNFVYQFFGKFQQKAHQGFFLGNPLERFVSARVTSVGFVKLANVPLHVRLQADFDFFFTKKVYRFKSEKGNSE
jgi:hypothetical protein